MVRTDKRGPGAAGYGFKADDGARQEMAGLGLHDGATDDGALQGGREGEYQANPHSFAEMTPRRPQECRTMRP